MHTWRAGRPASPQHRTATATAPSSTAGPPAHHCLWAPTATESPAEPCNTASCAPSSSPAPTPLDRASQNRYKSLRANTDPPVPVKLSSVIERSHEYRKLFDPHLHFLVSMYGLSVNQRLRHYCVEAAVATYSARIARAKTWYATSWLLLIAIGVSVFVPIMISFGPPRAGQSAHQSFEQMKMQLILIYSSLLVGGAPLVIILAAAAYYFERIKNEPTRVFRRAFGASSTGLFNPSLREREDP
jgi:hypothetical protein